MLFAHAHCQSKSVRQLLSAAPKLVVPDRVWSAHYHITPIAIQTSGHTFSQTNLLASVSPFTCSGATVKFQIFPKSPIWTCVPWSRFAELIRIQFMDCFSSCLLQHTLSSFCFRCSLLPPTVFWCFQIKPILQLNRCSTRFKTKPSSTTQPHVFRGNLTKRVCSFSSLLFRRD